jgi:hypothetical protein
MSFCVYLAMPNRQLTLYCGLLTRNNPDESQCALPTPMPTTASEPHVAAADISCIQILEVAQCDVPK